MSANERAEHPDFVDEVMQHYVERYDWADTAAIELSYRVSATFVSMRAATHRFFTLHGQERAAGKFGVLRSLYFAPDTRMSQNEISASMNVASASVTYMVDALEKDGLVVRLRHPTDRRVTWVELTPDGVRMFDSLAKPLTEHLQGLSKGFTAEERLLFRDFLIRYRRNAEAMYASEPVTSEGAAQPAP